MLTSAECLAMLEEKQSQKKKDTEEKEQRKKEREEKRKQREEEAKKKVAEREEKKKQREALKKKDEEKRKRDQEKTNQKIRKAQEKATNLKGKPAKQAIASDIDWPAREACKRVADTAELPEPPASKKLKVKDNSGTAVNQNQCCVCFGTFDEDIGTGREWVECACTRWLHEDCVEEVVVDASGLERLCPLCLS